MHRRPFTIALRVLLRAIGCLSISLLVSSCGGVSGGGSGGRGGTRIEEIHLFGMPVALNLDNVPGPDGFSVRVYASSTEEARGIPIRDGALDILLFDGVFAPGQPPSGTPLHLWTISPQQLKRLASENRLGIGYELTLQWTDNPPRRSRVTVIARYRPASGQPVLSGPSAITLSLK